MDTKRHDNNTRSCNEKRKTTSISYWKHCHLFTCSNNFEFRLAFPGSREAYAAVQRLVEEQRTPRHTKRRRRLDPARFETHIRHRPSGPGRSDPRRRKTVEP